MSKQNVGSPDKIAQFVAGMYRWERVRILPGEKRIDTVLDVRGFRVAGWTPNEWATADISFLHSFEEDGTFVPVKVGTTEVKETGVEQVFTTPSTGNLKALEGLAFLIIRSGNISAEVAQQGPLASKAFDVTTGKTLTIASVIGGPEFNEITVTIQANTSDALSVTNPVGTSNILIKLANTTTSKNTASAIQTAIRALGTVGGNDVSGMTATADAEYTASPPVTVSPAIADVALEGGDYCYIDVALIGM